MRTTTGLLLATATVLTLSACVTSAPPHCDTELTRGGLADSVAPSGAFSDMPAGAQFPVPLVTDEASWAIAETGDGHLVQRGDAVDATVTIFDGASGQAIDGGDILLFNTDSDLPLLSATACATVGSRVVHVTPAVGLLGAYAPNFGVDLDQTLVAVVDIHEAYPGRASGPAVAAVAGLPAVTTAPSGQPGLIFTGAAAPSELAFETLIQGDGEIVEAGDSIVVNYIGVEWETRNVFDESWSTGRPALFSLDDVVPGFQQAVIGQAAGSRVLMAIPPSEGYGDQGMSPVGPTSTMLFVVDILGVGGHTH